MIDAVVGAMIMVMATSSLLLALDVAHRAFDQAGRYPLTSDEKKFWRQLVLLRRIRINFG